METEPTTLPPHARRAAEVARALGSDLERGLTNQEAACLLATHGPNRLDEAPRRPSWRRFLDQFRSLVVWILMVAAGISFALSEIPDAIAILAIVILNASLGFAQEQGAARALEALGRMATPMARVTRDGRSRTMPAHALVPGDRIELETGDQVPADARLLRAASFRTEEAALTGESTPVDKDPNAVLAASAPLADRRNMVYMGTFVASGRAAAIVSTTGMRTELGKIAGLLERPEPRPTPLQRRLDALGRALIFVCVGIVGLFATVHWIRGGPWMEVLLLSVSLAVAAVPEGLPAVVTLALAIGLQRMARRNALVRRLPSVETLGSVTVICSDKTGTLTRNEMTVREIFAGGARFSVTGVGYTPRGTFQRVDVGPRRDEGRGMTSESVAGPTRHAEEAAAHGDDGAPSDPDLLAALRVGAFCNNARVAPEGAAGEWRVVGDPTEGALLVAAMKAGLELNPPGHHLVHEIPFEAERRAMSVVVQDPAGRRTLHMKGAPAVVLAACRSERWRGTTRPMDDARRAAILVESARLAGQALRVLALASRDIQADDDLAERDLTFAGLVGMMDPPRAEAAEAVEHCRRAGIRPVMITGDHPLTALSIARNLGIAAGDSGVVSGADLDGMAEDALVACVARETVFARVTAEHKLRIVRALRAQGHVVAMTGDGVNDAPAVQSADIGIAMGRKGTDVTREAADMVLLDDNFASIVAAVDEGRGIFANIQKFVLYLLSTNAGEVMLMLFAVIAGWPVPLLATQILWINLVTDGLPALALGVEPSDKDLMQRAPRPKHAPVISGVQGWFVVVRGLFVATAAATVFALAHGGRDENIGHARTLTFCVTAFSQLLYAFAFRSEDRTLFQVGPFSNRPLLAAVAAAGLLQLAVVTLPVLQPVFESTALATRDWLVIAAFAVTPVTLIELSKLVRSVWRDSRRSPLRSTLG
jgi:Ca2+-transporting ATPase